MGLERTCAVWVLALSAAACSSPVRELGEEATDGATGGSSGGQTADASGGSPDTPAKATGGAGNAPRDAGSDAEGGAGPQGTGGGAAQDAEVVATGGQNTDTDSGVTGGRGSDPEAAGTGGGPEPVGQGGSAGIDAGSPEGGADACEPLDIYGPMPCTDDAQCVEDYGEGWYCDKANAFDDGCGQLTTWPVCKKASGMDAGAPDSGADACVPLTVYGPMPCTDDAQCIEDNGEGWYCDKSNTYDDGCGRLLTWPMCKEGSGMDAGVPDSGADACEPLDIYGPMPCTDDAQCIEEHGEGWYCDKTNTVDDGCGNVSTWPLCKETSGMDAGAPDSGADACVPMTYYGPPPCTDDAQCIADNGEGWYCDKTNTYDDGCGNTGTWPICRQE
ncbi:MAG: hypothetical protein JW940_01495 [Polyangiaceae bacterium]|nr:hypothetical protein [Polyangiaceae bacterium]